MKVWTVHEKPSASPVLIREGFSFGALLFGPVWFAAQRAWLPAGAMVLLAVLVLSLTGSPTSIVLLFALVLFAGFCGRDLVRWSVARRGFLNTAIVAGRNEYEARARVLAARSDLMERWMVAEAATVAVR
jgi:uncharacterized membrane protein (DUF4010 family)